MFRGGSVLKFLRFNSWGWKLSSRSSAALGCCASYRIWSRVFARCLLLVQPAPGPRPLFRVLWLCRLFAAVRTTQSGARVSSAGGANLCDCEF